MAISQLISSYESHLASLKEDIENFPLSISEVDIINDPNIKLPEAKTFDENDLTQLSLTQLNTKVQELDDNLFKLDKLWYINGYIQEINSMIESEDQVEMFKLEQIVNDLKKLSTSLEQLDETLIIKTSLIKEFDLLLEKFRLLLTEEFQNFLPNEFSFILKQVNDLEYFGLITIIEEYDKTFYDNMFLKMLFQDLKIKWDRIIDKVINYTNYIELTSSEKNAYNLVLRPSSGFGEQYFESLANFIQFLNIIKAPGVGNYFSSKISNDLTNRLAENINILIHNENSNQSDILIDELESLIRLAKESNWNILRNLNSTTKIQHKLNEIYLDWVTDKYIDRIRLLANGNFQDFTDDLQERIKLEPKLEPKNNNNVVKSSEDNWNEEWPDEEEEDGWEEEVKLDEEDDWGWKSDEDEENKNSKKEENPELKVKISKVPDEIIKIIQEYNDVSKNNNKNHHLVTAVKSIALGKYPNMTKSFLLLNDFEYLSEKLENPVFAEFATSIWNQTLFQITNNFKMILASIDLSHDQYYQSLDDYELDDENLNRLSSIYKLLTDLIESDLGYTNFTMFRSLIVNAIDLINYTLINRIILMDDISEFQSLKFTKLFDQLNNITVPFLYNIKCTKEDIASYNKQSNLVFLVNNHLKDIMERFYQGELFDFETNELINVLKSIFIKSELRDGYIKEIIETRNL